MGKVTKSGFLSHVQTTHLFVRVCCYVPTGEQIPCRVAAGIGRVLDGVAMPGDPKKVKQLLQDIASDAQRLIHASIIAYIDREKAEILDKIAALNPLDSEQAITVAMACLKKRHGSIKPDVASAHISELRPYIGSRYVATTQSATQAVQAAPPPVANTPTPAQQSSASQDDIAGQFLSAFHRMASAPPSSAPSVQNSPARKRSASSANMSPKANLAKQMTQEPSDAASIQDIVNKEFSCIRQISNLRFSYWSRLHIRVKLDYNKERKGRQIIPAPLDGLRYETLFAIYDSMLNTMEMEKSENRSEDYTYLAPKFYHEQAMDAMIDNHPERTRAYIAELQQKRARGDAEDSDRD